MSPLPPGQGQQIRVLRGDRVSADMDWIVKGKSPSAKTITVNATSLNRELLNTFKLIKPIMSLIMSQRN